MSDAELVGRRTDFAPKPPKVDSGYLARYAVLASSASTGAILKIPKRQ